MPRDERGTGRPPPRSSRRGGGRNVPEKGGRHPAAVLLPVAGAVVLVLALVLAQEPVTPDREPSAPSVSHVEPSPDRRPAGKPGTFPLGRSAAGAGAPDGRREGGPALTRPPPTGDPPPVPAPTF